MTGYALLGQLYREPGGVDRALGSWPSAGSLQIAFAKNSCQNDEIRPRLLEEEAALAGPLASQVAEPPAEAPGETGASPRGNA